MTVNRCSEAPINAPIAVIILTFNESKNISHAINSVRGWAQQIFVVDSYSTDDTVSIATSLGATVYQHTFQDYSNQWNWALESLPLKAQWTLKLDADERVTPEFKREFASLVQNATPTTTGIYFRRTIFFFGKKIRFGGVRENFDLRMWRTGHARFENRSCNEHAVTTGENVRFSSCIEHHDFKSLSHWIDRHNRYSSMEAREMMAGNALGEVSPRLLGAPDERRMWLRRFYYRLPMRPVVYFVYRYFFRMGFLDGRVGFRYAFLHTVFFYWIDLKRIEAQTMGTAPEILWPARGLPTVSADNAGPSAQTSNLLDSSLDGADKKPSMQTGER